MDDDFTMDDAHEVLVEEERRRIVRHLVAAEGDWVSLDELSRVIVDVPSAGGEAVEEAWAELRHLHVPILEGENVVEFDEMDDEMRPGENLPAVYLAGEAARHAVQQLGTDTLTFADAPDRPRPSPLHARLDNDRDAGEESQEKT